MLAEQVWDGRAADRRRVLPAGEGTRSATPLIWSHAALVRLAWTIERGDRSTSRPSWPTGTAASPAQPVTALTTFLTAPG